MPDHRQPGKVAYRLDEILLLALLSILAGAEGFTDMALNLARRKKGKDSVRLALKTAAWDDDFLTKLIAA